MAKKKPGIFGLLWRGWVWLASGFLHIFYLLALFIIKAGALLLQHLASSAKKQRDKAAQPKSNASFSPLEPQKTLSGDAAVFEQRILSSKSTVGIALGARGSGKSALGMRILENASAKTGRKVFAMGFNPSALPSWIISIDEVSQIPNGAFVLVDEGGITFSSRSSMSSANKILSSLLLVARHKDVSAIFISQNSANLEVNAIRQADYLLLRKPSLLQKDFERKIIGKIYDGMKGEFERLPQHGRHSTCVYSDEFRGFLANELPSFWSDRASKGFEKRKLG